MKIDKNDLLRFIEKNGTVTIPIVANRYNSTFNAAHTRLAELVKQNKIKYTKLPPLPYRLHKKPFNSFRKRNLYYIDEDALYAWLHRQANSVCDRDRRIFFNIVDEWFRSLSPVAYIRIREDGKEKTVPYDTFEEEIKPRWKAEMYDRWRKKHENTNDNAKVSP